MENISDKIYRENQKACFVQKFSPKIKSVISEIICNNTVKQERPQMTIKFGACVLECWLTKAKNTHSE